MAKFKLSSKKIEDIISNTIHEFGDKIFKETLAGLSGAESIKSTFNYEKEKNRAYIYTDNDMAAYIEFGTGKFAEKYLANKPKEMVDEAMKFFINGEGTMPARPYLFKAFNKYKERLPKEIDKRIQKYFNSL